MKRLPKELLVGFVIAVALIAAIIGGFYGVQAYWKHLDHTSYSTLAWDFIYPEPRCYMIGYVAQSEQTAPGESLCVDFYAATDRHGVPEKGGVFIYVDSDGFTYTTDCEQIIYVGKDEYEASDFGWDSFFSKYSSKQRKYNMTELPFHFQLHLTPAAEMAADIEGRVHVAVIQFSEEEDPGSLDGAALTAWIEKKLNEGDPDGIDLPYYFDGDCFYWGPKVIQERNGK